MDLLNYFIQRLYWTFFFLFDMKLYKLVKVFMCRIMIFFPFYIKVYKCLEGYLYWILDFFSSFWHTCHEPFLYNTCVELSPKMWSRVVKTSSQKSHNWLSLMLLWDLMSFRNNPENNTGWKWISYEGNLKFRVLNYFGR